MMLDFKRRDAGFTPLASASRSIVSLDSSFRSILWIIVSLGGGCERRESAVRLWLLLRLFLSAFATKATGGAARRHMHDSNAFSIRLKFSHSILSSIHCCRVTSPQTRMGTSGMTQTSWNRTSLTAVGTFVSNKLKFSRKCISPSRASCHRRLHYTIPGKICFHAIRNLA